MYEPADKLGLYGVEPFSEVLDGGKLYIATGEREWFGMLNERGLSGYRDQLFIVRDDVDMRELDASACFQCVSTIRKVRPQMGTSLPVQEVALNPFSSTGSCPTTDFEVPILRTFGFWLSTPQYLNFDQLSFLDPGHGQNSDVTVALLLARAGDSGQGMTGGTIAGIVIADLILGRPNPWADVYNPKRTIHGISSLASLAEEFAQNIKVING